MDNSIIAIIGGIAFILALALGTELILTVIGGIIGMAVFFLPAGLIMCGANKLGISEWICMAFGFGWIVVAIILIEKIAG